jgi:hypothetical protein
MLILHDPIRRPSVAHIQVALRRPDTYLIGIYHDNLTKRTQIFADAQVLAIIHHQIGMRAESDAGGRERTER